MSRHRPDSCCCSRRGFPQSHSSCTSLAVRGRCSPPPTLWVSCWQPSSVRSACCAGRYCVATCCCAATRRRGGCSGTMRAGSGSSGPEACANRSLSNLPACWLPTISGWSCTADAGAPCTCRAATGPHPPRHICAGCSDLSRRRNETAGERQGLPAVAGICELFQGVTVHPSGRARFRLERGRCGP